MFFIARFFYITYFLWDMFFIARFFYITCYLQANDMNSTRNVDPDELFDLTDLPPPFTSGEEEVLLGEEDNDSTLQKIRISLQQLQVS